MQFSRTAPYYHLLERFCIGSALRQTRLAYLEDLSVGDKPAPVLIVGEGNGIFLEAFVQRYPQLEVTVIDESAEMLERARARLSRAGLLLDRVEFKVADLSTVQLPPRHYGLIVTHCFFTNFPQADVSSMVKQLAAAAQPQAEWLIGDFAMPRRGWRRVRAQCWLKVLYSFFAWTAAVPARALPDYESEVVQAGFQCHAKRAFSAGLLQTALYRRQAPDAPAE